MLSDRYLFPFPPNSVLTLSATEFDFDPEACLLVQLDIFMFFAVIFLLYVDRK